MKKYYETGVNYYYEVHNNLPPDCEGKYPAKCVETDGITFYWGIYDLNYFAGMETKKPFNWPKIMDRQT